MGTCKCGQSGYSSSAGAAQISPPPLAIAAVPLQPWDNLYPPDKALRRGTVFPNLDLPFYAGGDDRG